MEQTDRAEMRALFDEMGEESTFFFNRNHGNENLAMSFFEKPLPEREFYVMEDGGMILGYCFLWDLGSKIPWFGICVRERFKGQHIGTQLMEKTFAILRERDCGGLLLTTAQTNYRGQGLYEKCGFERLGVHPSGEFLYLKRFER